MQKISEADINKGQAIYSPLILKIYNLYVLSISNTWVWRCPKDKQLAQFNQYLSSNHLDIGVGTGYYLKHCQSSLLEKLAIMDLNPNCLALTKKILMARGITAETYLLDIFKSEANLSGKFNSISMNYLLHCLPGDMETKEICIANAASMLTSQGILFGATILGEPHLHTKISQYLLSIYNKKGLMSNHHDTLQGLKQALNNHLTHVEISIIGCVALFKGIR